jgi:predicted nucleic acid-binding protein
MSKICWDTMLFIYLLNDHVDFAPRVRDLLARSYERGDRLFTSSLTLGEVMAGEVGDSVKFETVRAVIRQMGFSFLSFDENCVTAFGRLRSIDKLKAPDSINLASAATAGVDMFLTGDAQLLKRRLHVPGIHFIADFTLPLL